MNNSKSNYETKEYMSQVSVFIYAYNNIITAIKPKTPFQCPWNVTKTQFVEMSAKIKMKLIQIDSGVDYLLGKIIKLFSKVACQEKRGFQWLSRWKEAKRVYSYPELNWGTVASIRFIHKG